MFLSGVICPMVVFGFKLGAEESRMATSFSNGFWYTAEIITVILRIFPAFGLAESLRKYADVTMINSQCDVLPDDFQEMRCGKMELSNPVLRPDMAELDATVESSAGGYMFGNRKLSYLLQFKWDYRQCCKSKNECKLTA